MREPSQNLYEGDNPQKQKKERKMMDPVTALAMCALGALAVGFVAGRLAPNREKVRVAGERHAVRQAAAYEQQHVELQRQNLALERDHFSALAERDCRIRELEHSVRVVQTDFVRAVHQASAAGARLEAEFCGCRLVVHPAPPRQLAPVFEVEDQEENGEGEFVDMLKFG